MIQKLLDAVTTTQSGASTHPTRERAEDTAFAQVVISGVASVDFQASCDGTNWVTLQTFTTNGAAQVALAPYHRAVATITSGSVTAYLAY